MYRATRHKQPFCANKMIIFTIQATKLYAITSPNLYQKVKALLGSQWKGNNRITKLISKICSKRPCHSNLQTIIATHISMTVRQQLRETNIQNFFQRKP